MSAKVRTILVWTSLTLIFPAILLLALIVLAVVLAVLKRIKGLQGNTIVAAPRILCEGAHRRSSVPD